MSKTTTGTYHNGIVTLDENPGLPDETKVFVTWEATEERATGPKLSWEELAEMRSRTQGWDHWWDAPGMEIYDEM